MNVYNILQRFVFFFLNFKNVMSEDTFFSRRTVDFEGGLKLDIISGSRHFPDFLK